MQFDKVSWLFLAGIGNSGEQHWQRMWANKLPNSIWLEHSEWEAPQRDLWVQELNEAVAQLTQPTVVVSHSLGCLLLLEWASMHRCEHLVGGFLVAVPDPMSAAFPAEAKGFRRGFEHNAALPLTLIASQDDPYGSIDYAQRCAQQWGASITNIGPKGHINASSNLGDWREGFELLTGFVDGIEYIEY
ncbi:alpha/beta hydrolase [Hahella sp. KA22]|uniref:RBBP9/YdeN family alpha/beta hydrolase n=1 Tax=Hahella sp. KA22 TaxID=1628392 RepID=UPI0013E3BA38|nr:alpha/beta fold hydrolase [Hahella sp. KA22]